MDKKKSGTGKRNYWACAGRGRDAILKGMVKVDYFNFLYFFSMGMVLIPVSCAVSRTSVHISSGTLTIRSSPLNQFLTSTV